MPLTKVYVYPYKLGSHSAVLLAGELGTVRLRENGKYIYRPNHLIVNWGNGRVPSWATASAYTHMLNKPQNVSIASDKIRTFQRLQQVMPNDIPPFTTSKQQASQWLSQPIYGNKKNAVVCRTLTHANSGRGIVLASTPGELVAAPLYTRYKPKTQEFRIHANSRFGIVDRQEKKKKTGAEPTELGKYIRSHNNDWVFCREGINVPEAVEDAAERALSALGLEFGAIDIGFHPELGVSVYEINTAPGIEGQTLNNYVNVIRRYLQT